VSQYRGPWAPACASHEHAGNPTLRRQIERRVEIVGLGLWQCWRWWSGRGDVLWSDAEELGTARPELARVIRELLYIVHSRQLAFAAAIPLPALAFCTRVKKLSWREKSSNFRTRADVESALCQQRSVDASRDTARQFAVHRGLFLRGRISCVLACRSPSIDNGCPKARIRHQPRGPTTVSSFRFFFCVGCCLRGSFEVNDPHDMSLPSQPKDLLTSDFNCFCHSIEPHKLGPGHVRTPAFRANTPIASQPAPEDIVGCRWTAANTSR